MIKRLFLALALSVGLLSPVYSAGTISLSLTQQLDNATQKPLAGGKLYFFQAGTTNPQTAYQDTALTIPLPGGSVYTLDAGGRIPQFFLADGQIKIRLDNKAGVPQLAADNILVIGPSAGGGSSPSVDPTTVLATGDIKATYGTGLLVGFVRLNGRSIGSATSGATERANLDTQALFQYLWGADANLAVSTGRGASAAADWAANKQLTLPDGRNMALAGLGDMGNSDRGLFAGTTFLTGNATTLGSSLGAARRTLSLTQLPTGITVTGSTNNLGQIPVATGGNGTTINTANTGPIIVPGIAASGAWTFPTTLPATLTSNNTSGNAFDSISPYLLITTYIKL